MNTLARYETLFLTVPEITSDEVAAIESQVQKLVKENQGTFISFERWGKMQLAYPVRNNQYGVYFLTRFEGEIGKVDGLLKAINELFAVKLNTTVMRHLSSSLNPKASLVYQRPPSLEEVPGKMTDAMMKEHRVGFAGSRSRDEFSGEDIVGEDHGQEN